MKVHAVYLSQHQLIPYDRIRDHFQEQLQIPLSVGSVFNFNQEAYERLEHFEQWVKIQLAHSPLMHADETGINIGGQRHWLHCAANAAHSLGFIRTPSAVPKPWMKWESCRASKGYCAMIMGSLTTSIHASTRYAMRTTSESWSGPSSKINRPGRKMSRNSS